MVFSIQDEGDFVIRISISIEISLSIGHLTAPYAIWPLSTNIYLKKYIKLNFNDLKHLNEQFHVNLLRVSKSIFIIKISFDMKKTIIYIGPYISPQ